MLNFMNAYDTVCTKLPSLHAAGDMQGYAEPILKISKIRFKSGLFGFFSVLLAFSFFFPVLLADSGILCT